jgi:hypothetical protein
MMFVYDAIDKDVGKELRKKNPNPRFLSNHHQWLKEFGRSKVNDQIQRVITIMKLCEDMDDFKAKFAKVFKKSPLQMTFEDINWGFKDSGDDRVIDVTPKESITLPGPTRGTGAESNQPV